MDRRIFLRTGLLAATTVALAACAPRAAETPMSTRTAPPATPAAGPTAAPATEPGSRVLLAYFSRPGENYYYGERIDLDVGNTQVIADMIAASVTVDVFRIDAAEPYPTAYEPTVQRNTQEQADDARPAMAMPPPDLSGYDTVLLGCPVWNVRAPMIMRTFIESVDLNGKIVHPFVTYAVSGMGNVRSDYVSFLPGTTVTDGLAVQGEVAQNAGSDVDAWLRGIGLLGG